MSLFVSVSASPELEDPPVIPPRSFLYHLEPIGIGTGMVEGLTSYTARLAAAHSVKVSALMGQVIGPLGTIGTVKGQDGKYDLLAKAGSAINGSADISKEIVRILGLLTGRDSLDRMTMQFASGWLSVQGALSRKQHWCGSCLMEMAKAKTPIYYPLLWQMAHFKFCPEHKWPLASNCPECHKTHYPLNGYMAVGFCPHCTAWLGNDSPDADSQIEKDETVDTKIWVANRLKQLIGNQERAAQGDSRIWSENIKRLVGLPNTGTIYALAKKLAIHRESVKCWVNGTQLPSIPTLLLVSAALDMPMAELVSEELPSSTRLRQSLEGSALTRFLRPPLRKHDMTLLREEMTNAAENPKSPPVSVAEVCRKVGCHPSFAVRKCPEAAAKIKKHWSTYWKIHRQQRQYFAALVTKCVASNLAAAGEYPSNNKMKRELPTWISLREAVSRKAWEEVLEEWGWKKDTHEAKK